MTVSKCTVLATREGTLLRDCARTPIAVAPTPAAATPIDRRNLLRVVSASTTDMTLVEHMTAFLSDL
jgi:hypothetical protein